jgi:hypothetical protein
VGGMSRYEQHSNRPADAVMRRPLVGKHNDSSLLHATCSCAAIEHSTFANHFCQCIPISSAAVTSIGGRILFALPRGRASVMMQMIRFSCLLQMHVLLHLDALSIKHHLMCCYTSPRLFLLPVPHAQFHLHPIRLLLLWR